MVSVISLRQLTNVVCRKRHLREDGGRTTAWLGPGRAETSSGGAMAVLRLP